MDDRQTHEPATSNVVMIGTVTARPRLVEHEGQETRCRIPIRMHKVYFDPTATEVEITSHGQGAKSDWLMLNEGDTVTIPGDGMTLSASTGRSRRCHPSRWVRRVLLNRVLGPDRLQIPD